MAKFHVVGADRESGEDLEMTVEAASLQEARSKANKRGILVAKCEPADGSRHQRVSPSATQPRPEPLTVPAKGSSRRVPRVLLLGGIAAIISAVALTAIFFLWIKPEQEKIQKSYRDAADQQSKVAEEAQRLADSTNERAIEDAGAKKRAAEQAAQDVAAAKMQTYTQSCEQFVREIKALRARVGEGTSYKDFHDKVNAVSDEYAQVGTPPDDADAIVFSESGSAAMERYKKVDRRWLLAIKNNLYIAEKYPIQEMLQAAEADVERLDSQFGRIKSKSR